MIMGTIALMEILLVGNGRLAEVGSDPGPAVAEGRQELQTSLPAGHERGIRKVGAKSAPRNVTKIALFRVPLMPFSRVQYAGQE